MKTKHLIFDFFGTLINYGDNYGCQERFYLSYLYLKQLGYRASFDEFIKAKRLSMKNLIQATVVNNLEIDMEVIILNILINSDPINTSKEQREEFIRIYMNDWRQALVPILGLEDTLKVLNEQGFQLSIISNTFCRNTVHNILRELYLEKYFTTITLSCVHGYKKPSKKIFLDHLKLLRASPEQSIYIGDNTVDDIQGSKEAGLRSILVDRYDDQDNSIADYKINSVNELSVLLEAENI